MWFYFETKLSAKTGENHYRRPFVFYWKSPC